MALTHLLHLENMIGTHVSTLVMFTTFMVFFVVYGLSDKPISGALKSIASSYFGLFYVFGLGIYILTLRYTPRGVDWVIFIITVAKIGDIGGYLIGRYLGKVKVTPLISPKKTLEGYLASVIFSLVAGWLLNRFGGLIQPNLVGPTQVFVVAALVNLLAQGGDLAESMIKRACEIKDWAGHTRNWWCVGFGR